MLVIDNGDAIRGIAEVASKLDFIVNGYVGTTATQLADGQLASTEGDLYASGANATVVTSITIVNTDSAARTFTLYLKPSGGTSRAISPVSLDLGIGYSCYTDGQRIAVLDTNGQVVTTFNGLINDLADVDTAGVGDHDFLFYDNASSTWVEGTPTLILSQLSGQATADFNMPNDQAITFGDAGEKIEGDGTDLTVTSSNLLNLSATTDVVIPVNVGLHLGDGAEKLESNNTDLTINSGVDINLTATTDINVPANVGITFGDDGEKIEGDGTDLTIAGNNINLTAVADVIIPANVGITFGTGEKIEGNNTDLTITSGADIALTATGDVNIPSSVGVTFGDDGEKIEGDGTDLTIASSGVMNINATGGVLLGNPMTLAEDAGIVLDALLSGDGKYSGIVEAGTAGVALAFGDIVYLAVADSRWELAKADVAATSKGKVGMVVLSATGDAGATSVLLYGKIRAATLPALTVGAPVHISAATAGDVAVAAPTGTTNFVVRIIGYGNTAEDLFFCPDNTYIELA